jgi:hypothetical protein
MRSDPEGASSGRGQFSAAAVVVFMAEPSAPAGSIRGAANVGDQAGAADGRTTDDER